jgi:hypothetical protein
MANSLYKKLHIPKGKKGKVLLTVSVSVAVILVALLLVFILRQVNVINPVAFKVGDVEVTVDEYNRYTELAKKYKVDKASVRDSIIAYHKDKAIAEKYKIDIPEAFLDDAKNISVVEFSKTPSVLLGYSNDDNEYTRMMTYIYAFNQRLQHYHTGGYGFVLFDFPYDSVDYSKDPMYAMYVDNPDIGEIVKNNLGANSAENIKKKADTLRAKLASSELSDQEALDSIKEDKYLGSRSQYGVTFLALDGQEVQGAGSMVSVGPLDPAELMPKLEKLKPGVSPVYKTKTNSYYFVDYKFKIDKDVNFPAQVKKDKDSIRVVEYDK